MHSNKSFSVINEISKASCADLWATELIPCRHFIRNLKSDFREICSIKKNLSKIYNTDKEIPPVLLWLNENFYLIESEYQICKKEIFSNSRIPSVYGTSRISTAFCRFFTYADFTLSSDAIGIILSNLEKSYNLTLDEYFLSPVLSKLAVISHCKTLLKDYYRKKTSGTLAHSKEEKYAQSFGNLIESLRCISTHNFDTDILKGSIALKLSQDPSGDYKNMTDSSKILYLHKLSESAKKKKIPEHEFATEIVTYAKSEREQRKRHVGYFLFETNRYPKILYFLFVIGTPVVVTIALLLLSPVFLFAFFPLWQGFKEICDFVFSKFIKSTPLPRMDLPEIPDNAATLVVITSLLSGENNDSVLFDKLEQIYRANGEKNVYFGILADIKDSKTAKAAGDEEVIGYAYGRINSLCAKYGKKFILFERRRSYSKSEEVFMGWERKRGAVNELVMFLKGKETTFSDHSKSLAYDVLKNTAIKYVVTLDADTNLGLGAVRNMCGAMLHPLAKPVIDRNLGIVTCGHGIMQPRCVPELLSAGATPFSRMMCGEGGSNVYSYAAFDVYQSIFQEGSFCGKGIFDVDAFYEVIIKNNTFPEDRILSHDSLEGAKLRSALLSDLELTDSFPKHQISYLKRLHRWIRGDIQNLSFLFPKITFSAKDKRTNHINLLSKFKIFDNARCAFVPLCSFICIYLAMLFGGITGTLLIVCSLFYISIPFISSIITQIISLAATGFTRRFFSKGVTTGLWQSFTGMLFTVAMLPMLAFTSFDAICKSIYRSLISKKKLLEWQTSAGSENTGSGLLLYVHKNMFSAFSGFLLFVFAPAGLLRVISILWFAFPVIAYHTCFDRCKKNLEENDKYRDKARHYAADIWNYFKDTVTHSENFLPPDNIQLAPQESVAHRTSPTNIGLYLLSVLCARDFGFIDTEELEKKLRSTISTIEKLEKFKGHLYNWYDTETLSVLTPRYISTVDSGNFTACLITLRMGLRDYVNESTSILELINRIEAIENATEYEFLYNKERNLFSLGAEISKDGNYTVNSGCYDLMMSEARTISYIQCAKRLVPKNHWAHLSRALITKDGYIGLSSWTGTSFEYFMPPIFLPVFSRSIYDEAMQFALREQSKRKATRKGKEIFGISESGYFSFDAQMNYRYRAFGVSSLALKEGLEKEFVISPYSSFLALCINKKKAFRNLDTMSEIGLYGKYGLYEAIDFTKDRSSHSGSIVKSYMSHHLGMSLCALCNTAFDNILQKRFMSDSAMNCAEELLKERIPVNAIIRKIPKRREIPSKTYSSSTEGKIYTVSDICNPNVAMLSNGSATILASSSGHIQMQVGKNLINYCDFDKYECINSLFGFAHFKGETISATPLPFNSPLATDYSFVCSGGVISHNAKAKGFCDFSQNFTLMGCEESVFSVKLQLSPKTVAGNNHNNLPVFSFFFVPVISQKDEFISHTSFSSLFVSCEYITDKKIILYKRKPSRDNQKTYYLAVALFDETEDFNFSSKLDDCFSTPLTPESFKNIFFQQSSSSKVGALIRPCCKITVSPKHDGESYSSELLVCTSDSKEKAILAIMSARKKDFAEKSVMLSEVSDKFCHSAGTGLFGKHESPSAIERILPGIVFGNFNKEQILLKSSLSYGMEDIWKHGISGDIPIILVSVVSTQLIGKIEKYIRAVKLLRLSGIRVDLCIVYSEKERYIRPVFNDICELIDDCDCSELVSSKNGGIFLVDRSTEQNSVLALYGIACVKLNILFEIGKSETTNKLRQLVLPVTTPVLSVDMPLKEQKIISLSCGDFYKNKFTVRKDRELKQPFSHILPGKRLSSLVTHNSLGYTWVQNSQNRRISPFTDNPLSDMNGERLLLAYGDALYDLCAMARYVDFSEGLAVYRGCVDGISYNITVYVSEKLCVKHCDVQLDFPSGSVGSKKLIYVVTPIMGRHKSEFGRIRFSESSGCLCFKNPFSEFFKRYTGFITAVNSEQSSENKVSYITDKSAIFTKNTNAESGLYDCAAASVIVSANDKSTNYSFILGAFNDTMGSPEKILSLALDREKEKNLSSAFAKSLIPKITLIPKENNNIQTAYSVLFNSFLPYQNAAGRFIARTGFYQSSGAYGFRDQLQDSLCLMYSRPDMTKAHIYRCCTRQFPEGDVLHWWHECDKSKKGDVVCKGVRTLCSDDYLWLPFAVAEFFIYSGDREFLSKKIHFAKGDGLSGSDIFIREKYMEIIRNSESATVYEHCKRAIDRGISRIGSHGLPLIGSCDWCDGYSNVGTNTDGESVWLGMFLSIVIEKFCNICRKMSDSETLDRYSHARLKLLSAIENHGYSEQEGQYIRAFYADGETLGSLSCDECKTDLLPQCFAPLATALPSDRLYSLAQNTYNRLFDREYFILKLFSPAFEASNQNPGYIKGYVPGIRENGGQYTHAAVWGARGFCTIADILYRNEKTELSEIVRKYAEDTVIAQNPVLRYMGLLGEKAKNAYKAEPYYLAGDIYSNSDFPGRAGWTIYTGSASWYYRLILENIFGIKLYGISDGKGYIEISNDTPYISKALCVGASIILTPFYASVYRIEYKSGKATMLLVDGEKFSGRLKLTGGNHSITVIRPDSNVN